jgi:hypothetical protein
MIVMKGRQEKHYECTNMGKVKQLELLWQCMSRHIRSGIYTISGHLILFGLSVQNLLTSKNRSLFPAFAWMELGYPFLLDIKTVS